MHRLVHTARNLATAIGRMACDQRGLSAIEFAMVLPLMLLLFLGAVEVSQGITADRKVSVAARTVADLVSQVSSIDNAGVTNVLNAASAVMAPYPAANLVVIVSSVTIDADGNAAVAWSESLNGAARTPGSTVNVPAALNIPNTSLIWGEAQYAYTPAVGFVITGTLTLKDQIYMRPRLSDRVTRTAS
jgi:Flp pilus assembly protein TadG